MKFTASIATTNMKRHPFPFRALLGAALCTLAFSQVTETAPPGGWSERDRRAFAAEAFVIMAQEAPMPEMLGILHRLELAGLLPGEETDAGQLLQIAMTGEGDRPLPARSVVGWEGRPHSGPEVRDYVPVSESGSWQRGGE